MSKIRKDNYVKATTDSGVVYGKVLAVAGMALTLATPMGTAMVDRECAVRITADDYRNNSVTPTAEAFAKPEAPKATATATKRPAKGEGKKAEALKLFGELTVDGVIPTRKAFSQAIAAKAGLSTKGASTYYYAIKSGKWTA